MDPSQPSLFIAHRRQQDSLREITLLNHFMNGSPTPEYPNPVQTVQVPNPTREHLGGCRKPPTERFSLQDASTSSTIESEDTQECVVDSENLEQPLHPELQLEKETEEEQGTGKQKSLEEDNNNLKLKLLVKEAEIYRLKAEISTLIKKTLTPEVIQSSNISKMFEYSTGFTYDKFNLLCTVFGIPNNPYTISITIPLNYKRTDREIDEMPLRNQLLFVLMKLRNNEDLKSLAFRFNITLQNASNVFKAWIDYMFDVLGELPIWPHRDIIAQNMPAAYKIDYPTTFAILDCTELRIERPTSLVLQSQSFSNYKSTNTLKALVACDPRGAVIFSSALFTGSMSDKEIVRQCGIISLLQKMIENGYLQRGDGLMADKGFLIEEDIKAIGLQLNLPPFARSNRQMAAGDVLATKRIAKHRVHVERSIAKIKKFKIVSGRIPNSRLGDINQIWYVVSILSNFQPHILKLAH